MNIQGKFYGYKQNDYDEKTKACIIQTISKLEVAKDRPIMMLGKIQSGKTRAFIGVTALAFDNEYDLAIVLTKNSNALAQQTVFRMRQEFSRFKQDDLLDIFDIMSIPKEMSGFELRKKLIIVVKKQKDNLPRMIEFIEKYALSIDKKCLIIDDEADFCSVGYEKGKSGKEDEYDLRKIASQINSLRKHIECRFVQVTATPYSLYLQPDIINLGCDGEIAPVKPMDTVLVPYGEKYIGGDYYFEKNVNPLNEYLFYAIDEEELKIIKTKDRRRFKKEDVLTSKKVEGLRLAIFNFIVGVCIRIIQNGGEPRGKDNKFSFIIHTETAKAAHQNQEEIVISLLDKMKEEVKDNSGLIQNYIKKSYEILKESVEKYGFEVPDFKNVENMFYKALIEDWITKAIINSENDVTALLDDDGQLRLRTPLNIFIGGQILDRGITISNLIGFYYGRSPSKMQQDSVLQHARMYGYRKKEDLAVTKLYTTAELYMKMKQINEFDRQLRENFEEGRFDSSVIFIRKDECGKIIPCAPSKILISNTRVLKTGSTVLPVGFNTSSKSKISRHIEEIDRILIKNNKGKLQGVFNINQEDAVEIIKKIYKTIIPESKSCLTEDEFLSMLKYLSKDKVNVYCAVGRNISRTREKSRYYSDMPYNVDRDLRIAREIADTEPTLMLMRQEGKEELGWKGAAFYWPVLVVQKNIGAMIYSLDTV